MAEVLQSLVGYFLLGVPFLLVVAMSLHLAQQMHDARYGIAIFTLATAILVALYVHGFTAQAEALAQGKWTAAALAVGLLPFMSAPIVYVFWLICRFIVYRRSRSERDDADDFDQQSFTEYRL